MNTPQTGHFLKVPNKFIDQTMKDLKGFDLRVLFYIKRHSYKWNGCDQTIREMVKDLGRPGSQIRRSISALTKMGLVHTIERGIPGKRSKRVAGWTPDEVHDLASQILTRRTPQNAPHERHTLSDTSATQCAVQGAQNVAASEDCDVYKKENKSGEENIPAPLVFPAPSRVNQRDGQSEKAGIIPLTPTSAPCSEKAVSAGTHQVSSQPLSAQAPIHPSYFQNRADSEQAGVEATTKPPLPPLSKLTPAVTEMILRSPDDVARYICYGPGYFVNNQSRSCPTKHDFTRCGFQKPSGYLAQPPQSFEVLAGYWSWRIARFEMTRDRTRRFVHPATIVKQMPHDRMTASTLYRLLVAFEEYFFVIQNELANMRDRPFTVSFGDLSNLRNPFLLNTMEAYAAMPQSQIDRIEVDRMNAETIRQMGIA